VTGTLYRGCAMVDHPTRSLAPEMAMLATDGQLGWLGPAEEAPDPGPGGEVVDAGGTTAVAGLVAAHRHLTLPGGAPWIDRAADPTPRLLATAEDNARLLGQAGVRWARDVGAPLRDGRALSLTVRERWRGRPGYPYVRVAGGWLARTGSLPAGLPVEVKDGDRLLAAALGQLDAGADLIKLDLDGPDGDSSPFPRRPGPPEGRGRPCPRGHGARPQLAAARGPGRRHRRGRCPGARVPAGCRPGPGHGRRWGRPWWRP
jgi:hypothetical protein